MRKILIPLLLLLAFSCGCGKKDKYEQALQYMNDEQYIAAISVFSELGDYENSQKLITECNDLYGKSEKYKEAQSMMEQNKYTEASDIFKTLGDYKDSGIMQKEALYQYALVLKDDKDLLKKDDSPNREKLYSILKSLGNYNDSESILKETQYERAVYCLNKNINNISEASKAVDSLGDYKDIYELYCELIEKKANKILTMDVYKYSSTDKDTKLNDLYYDISPNLKFARENFFKAIYEYAIVQMKNEQYEDASHWFYYVGKYDYLDAKEKNDAVKAILADKIRANAEKNSKEKEEQEEIRIEKEEPVSSEKDSVWYSTNNLETVGKGNRGVYAYVKEGKFYDNYLIIDFDEGYVYDFIEGENNTSCEKVKIDSGDLNSRLVVVWHDGDTTWKYSYYFKYRNQPDYLILEDNDFFTWDYSATDLDEAIRYRDSKSITEY